MLLHDRVTIEAAVPDDTGFLKMTLFLELGRLLNNSASLLGKPRPLLVNKVRVSD